MHPRVDYRISRVSAEFADAEVELAFREASHARRVRDTRWSIGIAALFYLAFTVTDYLALGASEEYRILFLTRLTVFIVAILVAATARRFWRAIMDGVTPSLVVGLALVGFLSITLLRPYESGWHGMTFIVMLMGVYMFIPNRFLPTMMLALPASVAFVWLLEQHFDFPSAQLIGLSLMLIVVNLIGGLGAHRVSRREREEYRDAEILRHANERLSREVEQRQRLESELRALVDKDELTGVANRRRFIAQSERALVTARKQAASLALLFIEIDHFQQLNDTYGYAQGDEVLRALVEVCQTLLREDDLLGRLGREEFALLLPRAMPREALEIAERLHIAARRRRVRLSDATIYFTISVGVARWRDGESLADFMRRADEALRQARLDGRNRVSVEAGSKETS